MKRGMTLVELLVVLAILASLAVTVFVSTSSLVDGAKVSKARAAGETIRDALLRSDGLGLFADMGIAPDDAGDPGLLALVSSRTFRSGASRLANGAVDPDTGYVCRAPVFREYSFIELLNTLSASAKSSMTNVETYVESPAVSNRLAAAKTAAGWRGPYAAVPAADDTFLLEDPFGGFWDFETVDGTLNVVSYAQDLMPESNANAATNDWRNSDIRIPVCSTNAAAISLTVKAGALPGEEDGAAAAKMDVYCIAPRLDVSSYAVQDGLRQLAMTAATAWRRGEVAPGAETTIRGGDASGRLSPGRWLIVAAYKKSETEWFFAAAEKTLVPGANEISLKPEKIVAGN